MPEGASYEQILYEVERGRARITLNVPERRNPLSTVMLREICEALWEADDDTAVHSVILRGAGKAFCAGYDLMPPPRPDPSDGVTRRSGRGIDDDTWMLERNQRWMRALYEMHKPTIAQVHGHCLAGGTDLALYCDLVIVADDANIGFPPLRNMGSPPNHLWLYNCGPQWTKRLLLTGDTLSGSDAAKIGFALKSVPADLLENEVEGLADRFANVDTALLAANKRIVNLGMDLMGANTLQRLAAENDARGHTAPAARQMFTDIYNKGIKEAVGERDAPFGDGRARVEGPEIRDSEGRLLPPAD
jgi:enoyl-CoA hydratase